MKVEFELKASAKDDMPQDVKVAVLECLIGEMSTNDLKEFWAGTKYKTCLKEMVAFGD